MRQYASRSMRGRSTKRRLALRILLNISDRAFYFVAAAADRDCRCHSTARVCVQSSLSNSVCASIHSRARARSPGGIVPSMTASRIAAFASPTQGPGPRPAIAMRSSPLSGVGHRRNSATGVEPGHSLAELVELLERGIRRCPGVGSREVEHPVAQRPGVPDQPANRCVAEGLRGRTGSVGGEDGRAGSHR